MSDLSKDREFIVLSGIRPTGPLHLGNHLGAVRDWVDLQNRGEYCSYYFLANLHMLTTRRITGRSKGEKTGLSPTELLDDQIGLVLDLLAAGIDPSKSTIYAQSSIPELTELAWLLASHTPVVRLLKMHHFREKIGFIDTDKKEDEATRELQVTLQSLGVSVSHEQALSLIRADFGTHLGELEKSGLTANAALLTYPVLMAADILAVQADYVPVGDDQTQHLEYARDIACSFNVEYGETFVIPEVWKKEAIRVPSLRAGGKMGKSEPAGSVFYADSPKVIQKKFGAASKRDVNPPRTSSDWRNDPGDPVECNVFSFYKLLGATEDEAWAREGCMRATIPCGECKMRVAARVDELFAPIREKRLELATPAGRAFALDILHEGGLKARARVQEVVGKAKERVGVPFF